MKRVVLMTRDSAYSRVFMERFLQAEGLRVIGTVLSANYLHRGKPWPLDLAQFVGRVGVPYALYQAYVAGCLPVRMGLASPRSLARKHGFALHRTSDIDSERSRQWLASLEPDFIVAFHFNQRVGEAVTAIPSVAALNFHPSLLPAWRGVDPVFFALRDPAAEYGASVHLIAPGLDEGDILLQAELPAPRPAGLVDGNCRLFRLGAEMAAKVVADFDALYPARQLQQGETGSYFSWRDVGQASFWAQQG